MRYLDIGVLRQPIVDPALKLGRTSTTLAKYGSLVAHGRVHPEQLYLHFNPSKSFRAAELDEPCGKYTSNTTPENALRESGPAEMRDYDEGTPVSTKHGMRRCRAC